MEYWKGGKLEHWTQIPIRIHHSNHPIFHSSTNPQLHQSLLLPPPMIFESDFFFNEIRRWNLGWPTPNYAGAWLATVVPCFWVCWRLRWLGLVGGVKAFLLLGEVAVWVALCMTFSRGGLVAAMGALGVFLSIRLIAAPGSWKGLLTMAGLRVGLVLILLVATGFSSRVAPEFARTDGAVVNRLDLWQGGLQMMAAAPVSGWGAGESGRGYMNWFQSTDRNEGYATMVNSYLHVGVERGLPVLMTVLSVLMLLLLLSLQIGRRVGWSAWLASGAGASIVAWALANVFTTLWIDGRLWLVPGVAGALLLMLGMRMEWRFWARSLAMAVGTGAMVSTALLWAGWIWNQGAALKIAPTAVGVQVDNRAVMEAKPDPKVGWVLVNASVLGRSPGKAVREWLQEDRSLGTVSVQERFRVGMHAPEGVTDWVVFGKQAVRLSEVSTGVKRVYVIHPEGRPPALALGVDWVLVLPGVDTLGNGRVWWEWAGIVGAELRISEGVGQDIRAVWPEILNAKGDEG